MALRPWFDNVRYSEFTPATIHYDIDLDAFYIARADIRSPSHSHRLSLIASVTACELLARRLSLSEAIQLGRALLDGLIQEQRSAVEALEAHAILVYDIMGMRRR
jgi:hypothetical protein